MLDNIESPKKIWSCPKLEVLKFSKTQGGTSEHTKEDDWAHPLES